MSDLNSDLKQWDELMNGKYPNLSVDDRRRWFIHLVDYHKYPTEKLGLNYCPTCHGRGYVEVQK